MSNKNRSRKPSWVTEETKEDNCTTCKDYGKCTIEKFVNDMSMRKQGKQLSQEFSCVYHEDVAVQHNNNNDRR